MSIAINAKLTIKPEFVDQAKELLAKMVKPTNEEKGCISYVLVQDVLTPNIFYYIEEWESKQHLDDHIAAPHFVEILGTQIPPLLSQKMEVTISPIESQTRM